MTNDKVSCKMSMRMLLRSSYDGGLFGNTAHDFKVQLDKQTLLNGRRFVALTEINPMPCPRLCLLSVTLVDKTYHRYSRLQNLVFGIPVFPRVGNDDE
jgi:hypothetical protein